MKGTAMTNSLGKQDTIDLYFKCMDTADFDTALTLFSQDAVYLRPPLAPQGVPFATSGTQRIEGSEAIAAFWAERGKRATHHHFVEKGISGNEWWGEGLVSVGDSEDKMFLCHVSFNDDGLIKRFLAIR
jgi:hypothetical protein